jgi:cytochrome c oxidase subunit 1
VTPVESAVRVTTVADSPTELERRQLEETWGERPGFWGWITSVDHKSIGKRFLVTAFVFFVLGGAEAFALRLQLAKPENTLVGPDLYNQLFTMHGTTMMFLFAVPVMEGMGLYLVPLMVGTRNVAFPRLAAYSYWVYMIGGLLLYTGFVLNVGPDAGWFSYVPLSGPQFSPGKRVDVWSQMISFTEIASLGGAVNLVATIFKHRAPGMSLDRMPLFVWAMLVAAFMIIFAMPAVFLTSFALASDRLVSTHFFNVAEGGDPILYQHLFWFFGHPEVYIIFLPATGMVSTITAVFSRREAFGYLALVLSLVATGFIGFGLWVHHMFTTNLPQLGQSFFTAASLMIVIPNGVQMFCWLATLWSGRLWFKPPLLFVLGFIAIFVLGGLSGVTLASVPIDLQAHDTYYVVAHFHYVLIGGAVFPLLGAIHFWFPKVTGKRMNDRLGVASFVVTFIGFNLTFFPMHLLGLRGMPRRVYTYLEERGLAELNLTATAGAAVLALGLLCYFVNLIWGLRRGPPAGEDPWGADSLEWATASPPPSYNFNYLPTVRGRSGLWTRAVNQPVVVGCKLDMHEVLVTNTLDAEPDHRTNLPGPSLSPLLVALATGVTFIVTVFTPWGIVIGGLLAGLGLALWMWPHGKPTELVVWEEK